MHEKEEEIIYILKGRGNMYFNNQSEKIEKTCILIPLKVVHSINNILEELLKIAYFIPPPVKQGSYDKKI